MLKNSRNHLKSENIISRALKTKNFHLRTNCILCLCCSACGPIGCKFGSMLTRMVSDCERNSMIVGWLGGPHRLGRSTNRGGQSATG